MSLAEPLLDLPSASSLQPANDSANGARSGAGETGNPHLYGTVHDGGQNGRDPSSSPSFPSDEHTSSLLWLKLRRVASQLLSEMATPLTDDSGSPRSVLVGLATILSVGTILGLIIDAIASGGSENDGSADGDDDDDDDGTTCKSLATFSAILGYCYFSCWGISFYPQALSNFRRKSTDGLNLDFCVLNVLGFACYTAYTLAFYCNSTIQLLYRERYDADISVQSNDVAFAAHALLLSSITLGQIVYYNYSCGKANTNTNNGGNNAGNVSHNTDSNTTDNNNDDNDDRSNEVLIRAPFSGPLSLSPPIFMLLTLFLSIIISCALGLVWSQHATSKGNDESQYFDNHGYPSAHPYEATSLQHFLSADGRHDPSWFRSLGEHSRGTDVNEHSSTINRLFRVGNWLDYIYLLSYIKIAISLIKYIPQVIQNKQRQSTEGWSIWNIVLDFTGGTLSTAQLILDCYAASAGSPSSSSSFWHLVQGNLVKLMLGLISIFFDVIFLVQHYVLYPEPPTVEGDSALPQESQAQEDSDANVDGDVGEAEGEEDADADNDNVVEGGECPQAVFV
uniref:Cystinosin n=1 Tax=Craspedostauros australis TaxID=1486917 RepID=A0A7R9ZN24_9STRA|mmetsp:Transcript_18686/g.51963  ORF Transcript_18686/g.51963 Transcript_18686/m.51963 type:complete len:564 (+) Transcript_18686:249-1940(+)